MRSSAYLLTLNARAPRLAPRPRRAHLPPRARSVAALSGALCILCVAFCVACGAVTSPPSPHPVAPVIPDEPHAPITLTATPPNPSLWIDGQPRGSLQRLPSPLLLPAGRRRVELRLDGYHPARADLTVQPDQPQALHLSLTPRLD